MASLIQGYNYDIFISYRQKDNKHDGWVTEFVNNLKGELESTFKEEISVYFDINPHDGLLETHDVDASLKEKLKCLIFIPIISRTYCDPKSFAWEHEFKAFVEMASKDKFGLKVKLPNGNIASRVLPVMIHEISVDDKKIIENVLDGILRSVDFIYRESGVNRPLRSFEDHPVNNLNKTVYRNQINKVSNAIDELLTGMKNFDGHRTYSETSEIPTDEAGHKTKPLSFKISGIPKNLVVKSGIVLIAASILIYFLVLKDTFRTEGIDSMTRQVQIVNENGDKQIIKVFRKEIIKRISVYPFASEKEDKTSAWLTYGITDAIRTDLNQFNYLSLSSGMNLHLPDQVKDARLRNSQYFLTGSYRVSNGIYQIISRLYSANGGNVIKERQFEGDDFFAIIDSISVQLRKDLGVPFEVIQGFPDNPIKEETTHNLNAFREYITEGENVNKAIDLDSTYALALVKNANLCHWYHTSRETAVRNIDQAFRHRDRLSENANLYVQSIYYLIHGEIDKAIALDKMKYQLNPTEPNLKTLSDLYASNLRLQEYENTLNLLIELQPDRTDYQVELGYCYLLSGKYKNGENLMSSILKESPENVDALMQLGKFYLNDNKPDEALKYFRRSELIQPERKIAYSQYYDHILYVNGHPQRIDSLKQLTGNFRQEDSEMVLTFFVYNMHLLGKVRNQTSFFLYQVSDSLFKSPPPPEMTDANWVFRRNSKGKVIGVGPNRITAWKEDSLIQRAMTLLDGADKRSALKAFKDAFAQNPDHYYLANFIKHLEFIQNEDSRKIKAAIERCTGVYDSTNISKKNNDLYFKSKDGYLYKLLPLTKSSFISPSFFNRIFSIVTKDNSVSGLEIIFHNGKKEFYKKLK